MSLEAAARIYAAACDALETWAERVREQLKKRATSSSQKTVAAALGISAQYLNDILRGRRPITRELVERILNPETNKERVKPL